MTLDEHLAGRLPERVELTAYYVSRPVRSLTGWIEMPIRWQTLVM